MTIAAEDPSFYTNSSSQTLINSLAHVYLLLLDYGGRFDLPEEFFVTNVNKRKLFWEQYFRSEGIFKYLSKYWDITNFLYFVTIILKNCRAELELVKILNKKHYYAEIDVCETSQSLIHEIGHNLYLHTLSILLKSNQ